LLGTYLLSLHVFLSVVNTRSISGLSGISLPKVAVSRKGFNLVATSAPRSDREPKSGDPRMSCREADSGDPFALLGGPGAYTLRDGPGEMDLPSGSGEGARSGRGEGALWFCGLSDLPWTDEVIEGGICDAQGKQA